MLTSSQQQALNTSTHLSVTANAGSGKTMVLVERYINILTSGKAQVDEVVAITFTEKAASELKRKIADSVAKKIVESTNSKLKNALEEIREQLSGAVIGTIHSFCSKMLREYPVEAGVDAAFSVLEGVDQEMMVEAAMKDTFDSILKEEQGKVKREQLFRVLRALGKHKVLAIVHTLASKRERVERWLGVTGLYDRSDEEVLATWRKRISEFVKTELDDVTLLKDAQEICDAANGKTRSTAESLLTQFKRAKNLIEQVTFYAELMESMLTQKGALRKDFIGKGGQEHLFAQAERLSGKRGALLPLVDFVRDEKNDEVHRGLLAQSRVLLELYQDVVERYEQKKIEGGQLDFEDLQIRTRNLLRDESIQRKLGQRFKFIMVDEYQDTNAMQYEILLPLVNHLSSALPAITAGKPGRQSRGAGNLFIVGDPKQSIYGFRGADVTVFNRTKQDIEQTSGKASAVVLNDSFRPLRDLAAFVNLIFSPLMKPEASDSEVSYDPLVLGRQNQASGRVELLVREPVTEAGQESISEGELIARRILGLVREKHPVFSKDEKPRAVSFSDISILLRSRTGLPGIEEAFIRHNIPYLVSGGVGYFQTQGIYDFYNYFSFLLNTEDDVALVGILRSPFFNVSDAELFDVAYQRRTNGLWNQLSRKKGKAQTTSSLLRAVDILAEDIAIASRLSIPDLVNRIIDETSYAGFVAGTARAGQISANLEKLKRLARGYEAQGFTNLYDFAGRLRRLIEEEESEGQAAVDVLADAVKIMTVHGAKGLEFPVVIVPSLERRFRSDNEPLLDDELGFTFTPLARGEKAVVVPIAEFLKCRTASKMIAEEKRILYVACTRARDMLILSGVRQDNRSSHSWMNWLLNGLQIDESLSSTKIVRSVETQYLRVEGEQYNLVKLSHALEVHMLTPADLSVNEAFEPRASVTSRQVRLLIDPVEPTRQGEIFSASKIRTFTECPSKYYLRYVVGLPTHSIRLPGDLVEEENDAEIPGDLRGRAFHSVMQHIDTLGHERRTIISELKKNIVRNSYSILSEPSIELEALADSVLEVVNSDIWKDVKAGTRTLTEFTIMTALGDDFLTGTLDRVYCDADGVWHVLDYKTDSLSSHSIGQKAAHYEPQIKFYSLLVQKFFSAEQVRATLLFTSAIETPISFLYSQNDLKKIDAELVSTINKIRLRQLTRSGKPCNDCPFLPNGCLD